MSTPLSVEEVLGSPALGAGSPPDFSPDNQLLAYLVTDYSRRRSSFRPVPDLLRAGVPWFAVTSDIWLVDLDTGQQRNLTKGRGHAWGPRWDPQGSRLAFLADLSGADGVGPAGLWVWERSSDTLRQLGPAQERETVSGLQWADLGRSIVVTLFPEDLGRDGLTAAIEGSASKGAVKVFEFDASKPDAARSIEPINLDFWRTDLGVVDAETGEVRRLTRGLRIGHHLVSPDGTRIACSVLGSRGGEYRLVVLDIATGAKQTVVADVDLPFGGNTFTWSPDGAAIAWRTGGPAVPDQVFVCRVGGGQPELVADCPVVDQLTTRVEPPVWDSEAANVFFVRNGDVWRAAVDGSGAAPFVTSDVVRHQTIAPRGGRLFSPTGKDTAVVLTSDPASKRVGMARVDLRTGSATPLYEEDRRYGGYDTAPAISPDGSTVAYLAEDALTPADIYLRESDLSRPRRVTQVAPALTRGCLGRAEIIDWHGIDGETHRGALVYPAGYEPGRACPLIVKVYGGGEVSNKLNLFGYGEFPFENLQLFATRGYALLLADSKVNIGTPMVDLMKTVMPGINKTIAMGVADPARVGITGHSYGGYSTLALIAQSSVFKAAVVRAGLADLIGAYGALGDDGTNYGLAWAESGQGRMGGTPWQVRERYLENSPLYALDRVQTPVLLTHGSRDDAVPAFLADQVFTCLRRLGKTVTYVRYEGEGHVEAAWSRTNQIDALTRTIAWFDRYLTPD